MPLRERSWSEVNHGAADPILRSPIEIIRQISVALESAGVRSEHIQSVSNLCDARIQSRGIYEGPER